MLCLSFYNHNILVKSKESTVLQKLTQEFHFFCKEETCSAQTTIELEFDESPELPPMVAKKILENTIIYNLGDLTYLDYFGEALTIRDKKKNLFKIFSKNEERLFELAFLTIHSILGQGLEKKGLCRIHAAAFSLNQMNTILMLPSKGGKSTIIKELISRDDKIKIISDDMPICNFFGRIHSFPSKLSFDQVPVEGPLSKLKWTEFKRHQYPVKWTASLSQLVNNLETSPEKNKNILIAGYRLSNGQSILSPVSKHQMIIPIFEHMIIGRGLPQIVELFLDFSWKDFLKLPFHAFIRLICAANLIINSKCYFFYMGKDIEKNSQTLIELINDS